MLTSTHLGCTPDASLTEIIRAVRAAGFDALELSIPKLTEYLASSSADHLAAELDGLAVSMIDVLMPIERQGTAYRRELVASCERWAALAARLGAPALQVVALDEFAATSWREQRAVVVESLRRLADTASRQAVRLALEPVCFSPLRTLEQAREVLDAVGRERIGLVLDTWHLWVAGTPWDEVAELDAADIVTVQVGDCLPPRSAVWSDADRGALPGEGLVPMDDALPAILRTGYRGYWSAEMAGAEGGDPGEVYRVLGERLRAVLHRAVGRTTRAGEVEKGKLRAR